MISLRSRQFSLSLVFLLVLLAAAIQCLPMVQTQSALTDEELLQSESYLALPVGCQQTLLKRAVGAIPISSSFPASTARQAVSRRAVGSVADSTKISILQPATRLKARSVSQESHKTYHKKGEPTSFSQYSSGEPIADSKYSRGRAW